MRFEQKNLFYCLKLILIIYNKILFLNKFILKENFKKKWINKLFKWRLDSLIRVWQGDNLICEYVNDITYLYKHRYDYFNYKNKSDKIKLNNEITNNLLGRITETKLKTNLSNNIVVFDTIFFSSLGHYYYAFGFINLIKNNKVKAKKVYFNENIEVINRYLYKQLMNYANRMGVLTTISSQNYLNLLAWEDINGNFNEPNRLLINNRFHINLEISEHESSFLNNYFDFEINKKIIILDLRNSGYNDRNYMNFSIRNHSILERKKIINLLEKYLDHYNIVDISNHKIVSKLKKLNRKKFNKESFSYISSLLFIKSIALIGNCSGPLVISKLLNKKVFTTSNLTMLDLPFIMNENQYIQTKFKNLKQEINKNYDLYIDCCSINKFGLYNLGYEKKDLCESDLSKLSEFLSQL